MTAVLLVSCGAPKPRPVIEPPPTENLRAPVAPRGDLTGWWISSSASGPGSEGVRRVQMIFNRDGSYEGMAVVEENEGLRFRATRGKFTRGDGTVTVEYSDGRSRTFAYSWDAGDLVLREGGAEIRLREAGR